MAGINKVMLIGNLGKDPEIRHLDSGVAVANFSLATTETFTNKQGEKVSQTEWHNIVLWRGLAEVAEKYLNKGDSVCIEGKLKTRSWEDDNGVKKYATDIQADNMTMLGSRRDSEPSQSGYVPPVKNEQPNSNSTKKSNLNSVEDLPFS